MEYKETHTLDEAVEHIKTWSKYKPNQEVCGFIGFDDDFQKYIVTVEDNIAQDPENYFAISPVRFLKFKSDYRMGAVWHSHIYGSEEPSMFDERMAHACQMPFFIYSLQTEMTGIYIPENSKHKLEL